MPDCVVTPFAVQPGQVLTPERCAVALRVDGAFGSWVGVWRPAERQVRHLPAPEGWLAGAGLWTPDGELRLPCSTPRTPCGVARLVAPDAADAGGATGADDTNGAGGMNGTDATNGAGGTTGADGEQPGSPEASAPGEPGDDPGTAGTPAAAQPRPVPLQQAPLARLVTK